MIREKLLLLMMIMLLLVILDDADDDSEPKVAYDAAVVTFCDAASPCVVSYAARMLL